MTSVGATNPVDGSVALFSNTGSWVSTYTQGVAVVSTMPVTLQGSLRGDVAVGAVGADPAGARPTPTATAPASASGAARRSRAPAASARSPRSSPAPPREEPGRARQARDGRRRRSCR